MEKFSLIDNLKVYYQVQGNGSPLLLMHGWGCSSSTVASIASVAAQTHTVINIDLPGFGKSQEPPTPWDVYDYADFVDKFVESLNLNQPLALAGHSFGGRLSIIYASRHAVDKVILIDAAGVKPRRSLKYYFKVYSYKTVRKITRVILGKTASENIAEKMRGKSGSADYKAASPVMRAVLSKVVNQDLRHLMPKIKAPTLLIWGELDTATPMREARIMEKLIPDAGLVSFPNCGHYSFLDNPVQFAAVLHSFLKS